MPILEFYYFWALLGVMSFSVVWLGSLKVGCVVEWVGARGYQCGI